MISWPGERARFASRFAVRHLLVSAGVAMLAALLVFLVWYPGPTSQLLAAGHIYMVVLVVDVVCGPMLTLVLASPSKPKRELVLDLLIVGIIQLGALGYGLYSLENARPIAFVYEQDRLVVVAKNELYDTDCSERCAAVSTWWGIDWYIARTDLQGDAALKNLDLSLQGVSLAMRRSAWQAWEWSDPKLQSTLRLLTALNESKKKKIIELRGADYPEISGLMFLPLVSSKNLDWIAIFDRQGKWVDSLPIDGFD